MIGRFRSLRRARRTDRDDLVYWFGERCPICAAALGAGVAVDPASGRLVEPPGLSLEVGYDAQRPYWRLGVVGANLPPALSTDPPFVENGVDYSYLLCGSGHVFPDQVRLYHLGPYRVDTHRERVERWNMVAVIGAPASGKTYLTVRTLSQIPNINAGGWAQPGTPHIRQQRLTPFESIPVDVRSAAYTATVHTGAVIPATGTDRGAMPAGLLEREIPDAVDAIRHIVSRVVVDGERHARQWGTTFRQPFVVRTTVEGRGCWTGVVDLPGELFLDDAPRSRERARLRAFDALVWAVDPAVADGPLQSLLEASLCDEYGVVMAASLRPGTTRESGPDVVRRKRNQIQLDIGRRLTLLDNEFAADVGASLSLLVAVTKCDLIHQILSENGGVGLADLGDPHTVVRGVASYLASVTQSWASEQLHVDERSTHLIRYMYGGLSTDPDVRRERIAQIAEGLVRHYSQREAFWNLAHEGGEDVFHIPGGETVTTTRYQLGVPSIGTHVDEALSRSNAHCLQVRDLIMSAVGCGIAAGLGHETTLRNLLREPWIRLRVFLCSSLGAAPVADSTVIDASEVVTPLAATASFSRVGEPSAALIQLSLAILARARAV